MQDLIQNKEQAFYIKDWIFIALRSGFNLGYKFTAETGVICPDPDPAIYPDPHNSPRAWNQGDFSSWTTSLIYSNTYLTCVDWNDIISIIYVWS